MSDATKRLTADDLQALIVDVDYHVFPGTTLTVCCITLKNGFNVTGESACASPEFFDAEAGQDLARKKAFEKIWALEGYLLRQRLYEQRQQLLKKAQ